MIKNSQTIVLRCTKITDHIADDFTVKLIDNVPPTQYVKRNCKTKLYELLSAVWNNETTDAGDKLIRSMLRALNGFCPEELQNRVVEEGWMNR